MNLDKGVNRRLGRAMHDYDMLADGDRILMAVSGGIDSLVLAAVLDDWHKKAPISYSLQAVHVDMDPKGQQPGPAASEVQAILAELQLSTIIMPAAWQPNLAALEDPKAAKDVCFQCARSRRTQLFAYARDHGYTKIALGHHRDDIIETFFINLTCAGNISTMRPRQDLFDGRLSLIRPLAYLEKDQVEELGALLGLRPVRSACPLSEKTKRNDIHGVMTMLYNEIPGAKEHIFAALGNVRIDYLLNQTGGRRP